MKLNALFITTILFALLVPLCWYLTVDPTHCSVIHAGRAAVNGYYSGYGGMYVQKGFSVSYNPDIFSILEMKRTFGSYSIAKSRQMWSLIDHKHGKLVYANTPADPALYLYRPPKLGWKSVQKEDEPSSVVSHCVGSLENTEAVVNASDESNIGQLLQRPITTLLLSVIFVVAYYLWAYKIDVSAVAYSYEAVVLKGEYWRVVTASFSHFDLLHLGFNAMSLYQLGSLEAVYGSAAFLYLNLALVLVTMLICTAIYHILIHRYGRTDMIAQQAVGFSCVLFAWMVALSVRLKQFCPIFLFPSFCMDTWLIPLPAALAQAVALPGIPVNIGPFVLLLFTKLILPRSSFIGHLSGIIIGYPLAWNLLNWVSLPLVVSLLAAAWLYTEKAFVWTMPGYAASNIELDSLMSPSVLRHYKIVHILSLFIIASVPVGVYTMGLSQLLPRAVGAYLAWSAAHACRVEWLNSSSSTKESCSRLMLGALYFCTVMMLYDACNLTASVASTQLLEGGGLSMGYIRLNAQYLTFMLMLEAVFTALLFSNLLEARGAVGLLLRVRCSAEEVVADLRTLTAPCVCCGGEGAAGTSPYGSTGGVAPFSGTAHRLSASDSRTPPTVVLV